MPKPLSETRKENREAFEKEFKDSFEGGDMNNWECAEPIKHFFYSTESRILIAVKEKIEGMRKRLDIGDIGASSVSFPSGEMWTQEKRIGYNAALSDMIEYIREGC